MTPRPDAHGHLVLRDNGSTAIVPYFIMKTQEPEQSQSTWMAVAKAAEEAEGPYEIRRRIRGKMGVKSVKLEEDEFEVMEEERERHLERISNIALADSVIMLKDEMKVMDVVYMRSCGRSRVRTPKEDEPVLRTRAVSPRELLREAPKWDEAIRKELHHLFEEKQALRRVDEEEFKALQEKWGRKLEVLPSKVVITLKPGPRRKIRLVACGNFVDPATRKINA